MLRVGLIAGLVSLIAAPALAQGEGVGPAPKEARAVVGRALQAMGGKKRVRKISSAVMTVKVTKGQIQERHSLRLEGRYMHYASRRASGAGFDVVLGGVQAFLCDRDKKNQATYVQDLSPPDAREGAYERDILFMPFILPRLLEKGAQMDYRGKNSKGHEVIRVRIKPPKRARHGKAFTIRLRFDKQTHVLSAAMGVVPWGHDKGKKRYCVYEDYRKVKLAGSSRTILVPHKITDQRGKSEKGRVFEVHWQLNKPLHDALFVKPRLRKPSKTN